MGIERQTGARWIRVGIDRGRNHTFTHTIPSSALIDGTNSLIITPVSGSATNWQWLSPGFVFDCIQLDAPE
ncbi:MAG: polysaccharide lyase family protein [Akkermansiaceae bacterium]